MPIQSSQPPGTILIVDDEESVRRFLRTLLTKQGYTIHERSDASGLVAAVHEVKPDLVLLDVMMPLTDGFEALSSLREAFSEAQLPIIMLTALGSREDAVRGFRLGANDYLTKPPALKELLERVDTQLRLHGAQGAQRLGHYELLEQIGAGGMAYVYKARDLDLNMIVALKVVRREYADDPQFLARLRREAEHLARVVHPNVIRFLGVEDFGQTVGLVVEYLEGRTLDGLRAPERQAARIGTDIARGLAALHELGLVHRDIKPDNVFLTREGTAKVFDFGIAAAREDTRFTSPGVVVGTPSYMSPEQARGQIGAECDVYALGCLLFELVAGRAAFPFREDLPALFAAKEEGPPRLSDLPIEVSPALSKLVASLMHPNPTKRPRDLELIAEQLSVIAGHTIEL